MSRISSLAEVTDEAELRQALAVLLEALLELHHLTHPSYGGSTTGGSRGGSDLGTECMPRGLDPANAIWRRIERDQLRRIHDQARWIRDRCRGKAIVGPPKWRCPGCGTHQPGTARACGKCIPQVLRPEQPTGGTTPQGRGSQ